MQDIDPDEIMMKQLKQMEKQRKDMLVKLKQQEKKVYDINCCKAGHFMFSRLTILNVLKDLKRSHCCRNTVRNNQRVTGSFMSSRKRRE